MDRLERWPDVSGARSLRGRWKGCYRVRTGDYRVVFEVEGDTITILRVSHRKDVYEG